MRQEVKDYRLAIWRTIFGALGTGLCPLVSCGPLAATTAAIVMPVCRWGGRDWCDVVYLTRMGWQGMK